MSKLRIGIVGTGQRVCHHGGCVFTQNPEQDDCGDVMQLAALCDNRPERLAEAKAVYEQGFGYEIAAYENFEAMYDEAGLDGVYIAGPNGTHRDMTLPALERGLHVLCEKPMDLTLAKCNEMIAAAERSGKLLAFAMQMHYRVRYHKVRELIEQGAIGKPAMLWCTEYRPTFSAMKDWVWKKETSGGAIVEKNCHHYDILDLWVQSEPTTVFASGNIMKHHTPHGFESEIVDNAWIVNDYASGARAMVGICFLAEKAQGHEREFGVIGTEGKISFSLVDDETLHLTRGDASKEAFRMPGVLRGGLFRDFLDCMISGETPFVTAERARRSMLVPLAAERSMEEGRVVNVAELA